MSDLRLSFTTLACPDWSMEEIVRRAVEYGYGGVEFRGLLDQVDITQRPEFRGTGLAETARRLGDAGLAVPVLGSSVHCFPPLDPVERRREDEEFRRYVEVATGLGAGAVRLFGGTIPAAMSWDQAVQVAGERLAELADLAAQADVRVVVESHDSFSRGRDLAAVLDAASHPAAGALWDVFNSQIPGGETLEASYAAVKPRLRHLHVKDGVIEKGHWRYTPMGEGQIPYEEIFGWLKRDGYQGWLSVEWEKRWHPELDEPDVVLPQYAAAIREMWERA